MKWNNSKPSYCDFRHEERKLFFSKYVQCSRIELLILHKLCISWEAEIPYAQFLHKIKRYSYNIEKILAIFLRKLERCGFALVRMTYDEYGRHVPEKIILSNRYTPFLMQMKIEEYYYHMQRNPESPYLTQDTLGISEYVEGTDVRRITLDHVYNMYSKTFEQESTVCIIDIQGVSVVLCASAFDYFYSATKCKFLVYMANQDIISEILKKYTQFIDRDTMQRYVNNDEYNNLYKLTTHLLEHYARISGMPVSAHHHLFQALIILHHISKSEVECERQTLIKTTRFTQDFRTIYSVASSVSDHTMSKDAYHLLLKKYNSSWKNSFQDNVIKLHTNSRAFPLLIANNVIIHKDNIKPYLTENYKAIRSAILNALIADVHERIVSKDIIVHINYSSMSRIEHRILRLLEHMYPVVHHLLEYPQHYVSNVLSAEFAIDHSTEHAERTEQQHGVHAGQQHGMHTEQQHGMHTEQQHGMHTEQQHGVHTEQQHGVHTEQQHGMHTEQQHGMHTEQQHGMHAGQAYAERAEEMEDIHELTDEEDGVYNTYAEDADDGQGTGMADAKYESTDTQPLSAVYAYENTVDAERMTEAPHTSAEASTADTAKTDRVHYYATIFLDIDPLYVFLHACKKLSFIRRLLYRFSNEYASLRTHFAFLSKSVAARRPQQLSADSSLADTSRTHADDTKDADQAQKMWTRMYYILWLRSKNGSNAA